MVEPVSTTAAGVYALKKLSDGLGRVLGPAADEIAEALRRWTEFRVRNVGRIVDNADKKSRASNTNGQVPPRVAHRLLDEGSFCDDEIMAEYLGGVLAGSRTMEARDDRGVTWVGQVSEMSSLEVRAHFLLYDTWARALHGTGLDLWNDGDRKRARLHIDELEFMLTLSQVSGVEPAQAIGHALIGLQRRGFLGEGTAWGPRDHVVYKNTPFENVVVSDITHAGIELYGWALGIPGMTWEEFIRGEVTFNNELLPHIEKYAVPGAAATVRPAT